MDKKDNDVNRFWNKYHEAVIKNGVSEKYADYYVKWAQKFALSIKGKPLNKRTLDDIRQFISKVKNYKNVPEWKVKQVREAIYILYYKFLKINVGNLQPDNNHNQKELKKSSSSKKSEKKERFLFTKKEIEDKHKTLLEKIYKEIRYRHYSIRTESSYMDWIIK